MFKFYKYNDFILDRFSYLDHHFSIPFILQKNEIENFKRQHRYLLRAPDYFIWPMLHLAKNPSEVAVSIIDEYIEILEMWESSLIETLLYLYYNKNSYATNILERYLDRIRIQDTDWWTMINMRSNSKKEFELCKKYNKIDCFYLSYNCSDIAVEILYENQNEIDWVGLSMNTNDKSIKLLEENMEKIDWHSLSMNSNDKVYDLLKENEDKIVWDSLSLNKNNKVLTLLENNIDKINNQGWYWLSSNNSNKALEILEAHQDRIVWPDLAENDNDRAIELLRSNLDKIQVHHLFPNTNPKAMDLIKQMGLYGCKNVRMLFENPNIFTYNYEAIKDHMKNTWLRDLLKYWHHPKNMNKWADWGWEDIPIFDDFGECEL